MEQVFNKLVRDNIPDIIIKNGGQPFTRILSEEEFRTELINKLYEEYNEVVNSSGEHRIEELADMLEVIKYLAEVEGSNLDEVIDISHKKALKRGAFDKKVFLEKTID